jgi:hypothetical protein
VSELKEEAPTHPLLRANVPLFECIGVWGGLGIAMNSRAIIDAITVIAVARSWILLPQPKTFLFTLWCQSC